MQNIYSFIDLELDKTVMNRFGLLLEVVVTNLIKTRSDPINLMFLLSMFCN